MNASPSLDLFRKILESRHALNRAVRDFFYAHDYIEVDTPIWVKTPALEDHIDAVASEDGFLRTSPELHMKRLVAAGHQRIFQISPCFRRGEYGALHHPEYSMLEWYRAETDYRGILDETRQLLAFVAQRLLGTTVFERDGLRVDLAGEWDVLSVRDLFCQHAGWDPVSAFDAERFDLDLVEKVEPALPCTRPVVVMDYPERLGALARLKKGDSAVAERWELYLCGVEIANAYSELTDSAEQVRRFSRCAKERSERGQPVYELDQAFLETLDAMPPTGGIALGMDRLLMVLCGKESLDEVLPFRDEYNNRP